MIRETSRGTPRALRVGVANAATGSHDSPAQAGAAAAAVGAVAGPSGTADADEDRRKHLAMYQNAAGQTAYDERHLLAGPFGVPPRMFVKRYVMLRYPSGAELPCVLTVCFRERFGCVDTLLLSAVDAAQSRPRYCPASS
jgi:hypothetical protein